MKSRDNKQYEQPYDVTLYSNEWAQKNLFQNQVALREISPTWLVLMRSDSELQICTFRFEKGSGLRMQFDSAKSDGTKSDLIIRWPKSSDFGSDFGPSDDSAQNRKMAPFFYSSTKNY